MVKLLTLLTTRQTTILSGASVIMIAAFGSKLLGLVRDRLLVANFDTATTSIYFGAFKLPDLLFNLLIFGALSVAFIPVFTDFLHRRGERQAFAFASNVLNLALLIFGSVAILAAVLTPQINSLLLPGFTGVQKELTDFLTRIILVAQLMLVAGAFFIGVAQSYQRFIVPSLAPLFYNLGIIVGIIFLSGPVGIVGPALGVVVGSLAHVLIQLPLIRSLGFRYQLSLDLFNTGVKEIVKLMSIRNIGLIAEQINDAVGFALATLISLSAPTLLTFSQHLYVVPIGLFAVAISQAALPFLARDWARGEKESFRVTLLTTMHQILFLTLPAAAILIVLRIPVVRLAFGASQFGWEDTVLTGRTVAFMALGLAAQSVVLLLVRGFYALKDARTPVIVSLVTVLVNIILSVTFIQVYHLPVWGLGLAYATATNLGLILLLYFLNQKVGGFNLANLLNPALKMGLAAAVAAVALYIPMKALDRLVFDTTRVVNLMMLTGIASSFGLSIYLLLVWLMRVTELNTLVGMLQKFTKLQTKVKSEEIIQGPGAV